MKELKSDKLIVLRFMLSLTLILCFSCSDNDETIPDYIGNWGTEKPYPTTTGYVNVKYYIELTTDKFKETFIIPKQHSYSTPTQIDIEGSVSVNENIIDLNPNKLIFSYVNSDISTPPTPYEVFTDLEPDFDLRIEGIVSPTSNHKVEYSLANGQLIIAIDYNKDGIYSDNEHLIYTKK